MFYAALAKGLIELRGGASRLLKKGDRHHARQRDAWWTASAIELDDGGARDEPRLWVVVHSITDSDMQLFHSRPLRSKRLAIRIDSPTGETVQVVLHAKDTHVEGELFETTGQFYR